MNIKINKFTKICSFVFMSFAMVFGLVACGNTLSKIYVKNGTLPTQIEINTTLNFDNLVLVLEYANGDKEEVSYNQDMKISDLDTKSLGEKEIVITYKEKTTKFSIEVVEGHVGAFNVMGVENSKNITKHFANKTPIIDDPETAKDESESSFKISDSIYKVGYQNPFKLYPEITLDNGNTTKDLPMDIKVSLKENDTLNDVTTNQKYIASKNPVESSVQFTKDAIGKTFVMEVGPKASDDVILYTEESTISLEFEVVDAWNVYTEEELSVMYNVKDSSVNSTGKGYNKAWRSFKEKNGISNASVNGVVLHEDLVYTNDKLPEEFFYTKNDVIYLQDRLSIFAVEIPVDSSFNVYGNYFNIDASKISQAEINEDRKTSHSHFFGFGGDNNNSGTLSQGKYFIQDLKMFGNAPRDTDVNNAGGLSMVHSGCQNLTMENMVSSAFLGQLVATHNRGIYEGVEVNINSCKFLDSYSNMLFLWSVRNTYVRNSTFKRAGGPLIMAIHVDNDTDEAKEKVSNVDIIDSVVENWVTGKESWFAENNASSMITDLAALNQIFLNLNRGKAFMVEKELGNAKVPAINLQAIITSDEYVANTKPVGGKIVFKKGSEVINEISAENPVLKATAQTLFDNKTTPMAPPIFQSSGQVAKNSLGSDSASKPEAPNFDYLTIISADESGYIVGDLPSLPGRTFAEWSKEEQKDLFTGDYLNVYLNNCGMIACASFNDIEIKKA